AYESDESGRREVYVQAFPLTGGKWQVSSSGGRLPVWRAHGGELFYIDNDDQLVAVPVDTENGFHLGTPLPLFHAQLLHHNNIAPTYDASADGQRFLLMELSEDPGAQQASVTLVRNWPVNTGVQTDR
ncbi:MAG: hypothetical protein O7A07_06510, partial [Acidobacteria bacterium]|nr:hypothetical protein [Acidobacteriota bacterium]